MSRGYRAYIRVEAGDEGKPLGKVGLGPVVLNLNGQAKGLAEEQDPNWPLRFDPFWVGSHLGRPTIIMEVDHAWEARVAYAAARRFLKATGWRWTVDLNSNTRRAI